LAVAGVLFLLDVRNFVNVKLV